MKKRIVTAAFFAGILFLNISSKTNDDSSLSDMNTTRLANVSLLQSSAEELKCDNTNKECKGETAGGIKVESTGRWVSM